jgi:beta-lactam-binding protein with PASTA domain
MSLIQFIKSRTFINQLLIAVGLLAVLIFIVMKGLEIYTLHGQSHPVPDFSGMTLSEAEKVARQSDLIIEVVDSLFKREAAPGVIVDQIPLPGHGVKQKRTIFLTVNSLQPEMVNLPRLTDISYRQAQVIIENSGLLTGSISYKPSEYNNLVLGVQFNGTDIESGTQLPKGSRIDLIVGQKGEGQPILLPNIQGFTITEAEETLTASMLTIGVIICDETILTENDSLNARIWRQRPDPAFNSIVQQGSSVDLWATNDSTRFAPAETPEIP